MNFSGKIAYVSKKHRRKKGWLVIDRSPLFYQGGFDKNRETGNHRRNVKQRLFEI